MVFYINWSEFNFTLIVCLCSEPPQLKRLREQSEGSIHDGMTSCIFRVQTTFQNPIYYNIS